MFQDFFNKAFYGNTLGDWLISLAIIVATIVIGKLLYWLFGNFVRKLTNRTKTNLDNIILDKAEEPVVFAFIIAGIWYALSILKKSESMTGFVDKVYYVLIIYNVTWMIVRLLDALITEYLAPVVNKSESSLDDQLLPIFRKGSKFAIWTLGTILALNNAGYDVGALIAGLGIGGLAFALAAQDLVKNLFGGFTIFVDKPFMVGQRINVAGHDGFVEEIGIRSLRLRTLAGRQVIIPNSDVANNAIENLSSEPSRKIVQTLGLTYDMNDDQVQKGIDLLKEIAERNEFLEENPLPEDAVEGTQPTKRIIAGFSGFGDFSLNILFIYYIKADSDYLGVQNDINFEILKKFAEHGLDFAFPTQTIITQPQN